MRKWMVRSLIVVALLTISFIAWKKYSYPSQPGVPVDSLNGVLVYYNGNVGHVEGRNVAKDGYNLGLKYQCVEFVKRYYYEHLKHKMPDSYGHAKDFFDPAINDGKRNDKRGLIQFKNPSSSKPVVDDLIIFSATNSNPYGHVAIIARVNDREIEIIQQNPGAFNSSRATFSLSMDGGKWRVGNERTLGWLRK
jgi:surface antigen